MIDVTGNIIANCWEVGYPLWGRTEETKANGRDRLVRLGIIQGHPHGNGDVVLDQLRPLHTTIRLCSVAVRQLASNAVGAAASHLVSLAPRMPTVLCVVGKPCADLVWIRGGPSV